MIICLPQHGRNISTIIRCIQYYPSIIDYIETKDFVEEEARPPCTGHSKTVQKRKLKPKHLKCETYTVTNGIIFHYKKCT